MVLRRASDVKSMQLSFQVQQHPSAESDLQSLIYNSIFKGEVDSLRFIDINPQADQEEKENCKVRICKVESTFSTVITGLKYYLNELAPNLIKNVSVESFNIKAQPFKPRSILKAQQPVQPPQPARPLQPNFLNPLDLASKSSSSDIDPQQQQILQKKQISQMYQYYNYLIFEKHKDSFNDIPFRQRKMKYMYDKEINNSYMAVEGDPDVIKAAMGYQKA